VPAPPGPASPVAELPPQVLRQRLDSGEALTRLDVREPEEYTGELGHISGSLLIPLKDLTARAEELERYKDRHIIVVCRAGVRSTTAAAILTGLGFEHVSNLKGGMLDWNKNNLAVERAAPAR